jgi:hypothetical protein
MKDIKKGYSEYQHSTQGIDICEEKAFNAGAEFVIKQIERFITPLIENGKAVCKSDFEAGEEDKSTFWKEGNYKAYEKVLEKLSVIKGK